MTLACLRSYLTESLSVDLIISPRSVSKALSILDKAGITTRTRGSFVFSEEVEDPKKIFEKKRRDTILNFSFIPEFRKKMLAGKNPPSVGEWSRENERIEPRTHIITLDFKRIIEILIEGRLNSYARELPDLPDEFRHSILERRKEAIKHELRSLDTDMNQIKKALGKFKKKRNFIEHYLEISFPYYQYEKGVLKYIGKRHYNWALEAFQIWIAERKLSD